MTGKKAAIVLGAGKGKRMKSDIPKVLHKINDQPMISILMETLIKLDFERIVVVIGHKGELVQKALAEYPVKFAWQREQLGTAHAVEMTRELMADFDGTTLVAAGDVPFLSRKSIEKLFEIHRQSKASATCLSAIFDDPTGYGRIIRDHDSNLMKAIVEHKDAPEDILKIKEINTGTFCFDNQKLFEIINRIDNRNKQGEYYLTDAVKLMHDNKLNVAVVRADDPDEVKGVNSREQLEYLAEKFVR